MIMNKVLVNVFVPTIGRRYEIFIPVNEYVWKINKLIVKSISDLTEGVFPINKNYFIINIDNGRIYNNNNIVISTDIRNNTNLILIEL